MTLNFFTGTFVYLLSHGESVRQKKVSDGSISKPRRQFCTKNPAQILLGSWTIVFKRDTNLNLEFCFYTKAIKPIAIITPFFQTHMIEFPKAQSMKLLAWYRTVFSIFSLSSLQQQFLSLFHLLYRALKKRQVPSTYWSSFDFPTWKSDNVYIAQLKPRGRDSNSSAEKGKKPFNKFSLLPLPLNPKHCFFSC